MFDELKNAIKAQLYERAISPLSGAFILSWVAWNYRFVLVLVSSLFFAEKISYIDTHIFPTSQQTIIYGLFLPFLSAMCWLVLYPYPAKFFYEVSRKLQRELKELQQKIDDEMPMDQEEARKIRREALHASIAFDNELKSKNEDVARLNEIVAQLQRENKTLSLAKANEAHTSRELDAMQYDMLSEIANRQQGVSASTLLKKFGSVLGSSTVVAQHCIDELERNNYIQWKQGVAQNNEDPLYAATREGRAIIANNLRPSS
jgi:hypothetical protein